MSVSTECYLVLAPGIQLDEGFLGKGELLPEGVANETILRLLEEGSIMRLASPRIVEPTKPPTLGQIEHLIKYGLL